MRRARGATSALGEMVAGATAESVDATDRAIIDAIHRGDTAVASAIYDRLYGVVDRTLWRVMGQLDADHDDLVQQVFEQVIVTLTHHTFAQMCSLRTWASRIATNVALTALRARRRERAVVDRSTPFDDNTGASGARNPQSALDAKAELRPIRRFLSEMPPNQVEILLLCDVMGHELAEICIMTGISPSAAQSRLFRARRELRRRFEEAGLALDEQEP